MGLSEPNHAGEVAESIEQYETQVQERLHEAELAKAQAELQAVEERKRRQIEFAKNKEERRRRRMGLILLATISLGGFIAAAAGVWYRDERLRQQSAFAERKMRTERNADLAVTEANQIRAKLLDELTKSDGVPVLPTNRTDGKRSLRRLVRLSIAPKSWLRIHALRSAVSCCQK